MSDHYRTFVTPPWRGLGAANLIALEDGTGLLLLEDGSAITFQGDPGAYRSRMWTPAWERDGVTPPWGRDLNLAARAPVLLTEDGTPLTLEDGSGHIVLEGP